MKPPTYRYRLYMVTNALGEVYYQAKEPHRLVGDTDRAIVVDTADPMQVGCQHEPTH